MRMPTQVYQGVDRPIPDKLQPIPEWPRDHGGNRWKPGNGLWTSTWASAFECGWPAYTRTEDYYVIDDGWLLEPVEANVYVVDGFEAASELERKYALEIDARPPIDLMIDWHRFAQDWDAVHCPVPWLLRWDTGERLRSSLTWYGWDCESTWWARWMFDGEATHVDLEVAAAEAAG